MSFIRCIPCGLELDRIQKQSYRAFIFNILLLSSQKGHSRHLEASVLNVLTFNLRLTRTSFIEQSVSYQILTSILNALALLKSISEVPSLSLIWLLNGPEWKTEKCQSINHKKGKWRSQYVLVFVVWLSVSVLLGILLLLPIMGQWQRIFTFIATIHSAKTSKTKLGFPNYQPQGVSYKNLKKGKKQAAGKNAATLWIVLLNNL